MDHHAEVNHQPDFGMAEKKLTIYLIGFIFCCFFTLISFSSVMWFNFSKAEIMFIIFCSAILQFLVQLIFFLRLHLRTHQGQTNVTVFVFTGVILSTIVLGSLWIMWNLNYNMAS